MEYRIFTFLQNNSLKTILIAQEAIDEMDPDGPSNIGEYFIGGTIDQLSDHGMVEIIGPGADMLDEIMVSQ